MNGNAIEEVRWMKDDKPIASIGALVTIRHPTESDTGNYKCTARNNIGITVSRPYRVEIQANPHNSYHNGIYCESKVIATKQNENVLHCHYKRNGRLHRKRSASENGSQSSLSSSKRKKINIAEDSTVTLNCDANRSDRKSNQLAVKWKKDGKVIRQSNLNEQSNDMSFGNPMENPMFRDDGRIVMHPKNGSITINSTIPSDAGIYEVKIFYFEI